MKRIVPAILIGVLTAEALIRLFLHYHPTDWFGCCVSEGALCRLMAAYRQPPHGPVVWVPDPLVGHRLKPRLPPTDFESRISSTALGARGPVEHSYARTSEKTRIVAIGDSYTFAQEVSDDEAWPAVLESIDSRREVVNLGAAAYGQDQALLMLRAEGVKYRPDIVIFGFYRADLIRNTVSWFCGPKPVFRPSEDSFTLDNVPVPEPESEVARLRSQPVVWLAFQASWERLFDAPRTATLEEQNRLGLYIMREIERTAEQAGAQTLMVRFADDPEIMNGSPPDAVWQEYCRAPGTRCFDPTPALRTAYEAGGRARAALFAHAHYNAKGNRIIAEEIDRFLRSTDTR